jgi:glycosyltransferase involved in cell wall biosynthesis
MKKILSLSIIFPAYNEAGSIDKVLREWIGELEKLNLKYQVIVCEDGSSDGTDKILRSLQRELKFTLNQKSKRRGYGEALIGGIKEAEHDLVLCVDSDGQCSPKDLKKFIREIDTAEVLVGWRKRRADVLSRIIYSKLFGIIFYTLFPTKTQDPSVPYVIFSKKQFIPLLHYLKFLKEGFWWGFVGTCVKKGISIKEIPITHRERYDGDTQVYKPSKMIGIAKRNILGLINLRFSK